MKLIDGTVKLNKKLLPVHSCHMMLYWRIQVYV